MKGLDWYIARRYLASRKRDLILRGGENVYPAEIEQRLEAHPAVADTPEKPVN